MSKSSVIGFPRIGSLRELKHWTEDYFAGKLSLTQLHKNAAGLREQHWLWQKQKDIDFIPSNDFSFYDGVLDTACFLNLIPREYQDLGLHDTDTYFAMARGYQGEKGDVKALAMRKWFNTNYHYIVPVFDDDTEVRLNTDGPFSYYREAMKLGIKTKPVLLGPFTLLKLADYRGVKKAEDFAGPLISAYREVFSKFHSLGAEWLQMDEPILVTDLTQEEIGLFKDLYTGLLTGKEDLKVLLQTYFGDVRDVYREIMKLGFDGIGLDFLEGKKNLQLLEENGFPKNTLLFAGVVNGKNIWRNNYEKTRKMINQFTAKITEENIVINTSCSLLHVPYSLENEDNMDQKYKNHFAFAREKLQELGDLKELLDDQDEEKNEKYLQQIALRKTKEDDVNPGIQKRIKALSEKDFKRCPDFEEREKLQKAKLKLPVLPATTIGSFPQTAEVKAWRAKLKKKELAPAQYEENIKKKIAQCIAQQEEIGLDVLVHGEFERNDMVEYFGENLEGFLFTQKAWVQSYGTRCVKPPIIWTDIERKNPITLKYSTYAQSLTAKPVKGMLTGPVTILNWSFPREDISDKETAFQIALAIRDEVLDLEAHGIRVIQIDEAALKEKLPIRRADWHTEYLDWAISAFRLVHSSVRPETQIHTHMCYSEFGQMIKDIEAMDADVISFEASRSNLAIVNSLVEAGFQTEVGPGVYDIHSPRVPSKEEILKALKGMLGKIEQAKLWVNPDCGLKTRGETETIASLKNVVQAVLEIREEIKARQD